MVKHKRGNKLEKWEIALIKAMLSRAGSNDQDILAYFTRPTRSINHRAIGATPQNIGVAVGAYMVRDVSRGIASIVTPMQALGSGDLTAEIPHQGKKTEIGAMADSLQVFKQALLAKQAADQK